MLKILDALLRGEIEKFSNAFTTGEELQPGFSLSIKTSWRNFFGVEEDLMLLGQVGWPDNQIPTPENWACVRLDAVKSLLRQTGLNQDALLEGLRNSIAHHNSPIPTVYSLFHGAHSSKYVCFSEPLALLAAFCIRNPVQQLESWYPGAAAVIPFNPEFLQSCRLIASHSSPMKNYLFVNRGLLVGAEEGEACQESFKSLVQIAENRMPLDRAVTTGSKTSPEVDGLPLLRARISSRQGRPVVLHVDDSEEMKAFIGSTTSLNVVERSLPTPALFAHTGLPKLLKNLQPDTEDLPGDSEAGSSILMHPDLGVIATGDSKIGAQRAAERFRTAAQAIQAAINKDICQLPDLDNIRAAANWEAPSRAKILVYSGEVALVTGAASGIGKAIACSLLQRGCSVVGMDINPSIHTTFDHPGYLGLVCDVADELAVHQAFRQITSTFGGLDILILNAGLFPGGCPIEKQNLAEFTRVINVNFISNLAMMREAFPLLRLAPNYGRVVMIGSKNFRAPGPGAAAYSTSKAALTQLARVAALEWGGDRIRVNVIHPDSVFDTALYTEEVLQARAAHYGLTVEQYKKRNLLKTEITSHDVAELVAEMCGPLFRHMTGGQIQLDGGNDRTI